MATEQSILGEHNNPVTATLGHWRKKIGAKFEEIKNSASRSNLGQLLADKVEIFQADVETQRTLSDFKPDDIIQAGAQLESTPEKVEGPLMASALPEAQLDLNAGSLSTVAQAGFSQPETSMLDNRPNQLRRLVENAKGIFARIRLARNADLKPPAESNDRFLEFRTELKIQIAKLDALKNSLLQTNPDGAAVLGNSIDVLSRQLAALT